MKIVEKILQKISFRLSMGVEKKSQLKLIQIKSFFFLFFIIFPLKAEELYLIIKQRAFISLFQT